MRGDDSTASEPSSQDRQADHDKQDQDRPARTARQAGSALFGPDLLAPGPSLWPFGHRARQRRAQRRAVQERAATRRETLRAAWGESHRPAAGRAGRWAPVSRGRHVAVVTGMAMAVLALVALSWWATSDSEEGTSTPAAAAPVSPPQSRYPGSPDPSPDEPGDRLDLSPVEPIPSHGVAPIVPDRDPSSPRDPQQVHTVPPPQEAEPSPAALSSPESAAAGWMAARCPFDAAHDALGEAEARAQPWMTEHGGDTDDPRGDSRAESSWQRTVAADESAACSRPQARVVPEAPRSSDAAIVQLEADRVVTGRDGEYVEDLAERRIVQRGPDGQWRVDAATHGG